MSEPLVITVIGAGNVGGNLARRLDGLGHRVRFGAREVGSDKVRAALDAVPNAVAVPLAEAATGTDIVVLAVPYAAIDDALATIGPLDGTIVIDATNAVGVTLPAGVGSVAEMIATARPGARVVKAFNTIGAELLLDPTIDGRRVALPIAGEETARALVAGIATEIGFDVIDVGDIEHAALVESFASMWIHLAMRRGYGRDFAFALLRG